MVISSFILPILAVLILSYFAYIFPTDRRTKAEDKNYNPKNTLLLFDIHGVIMKFSLIKIIKEIIKMPDKHIVFFLVIRPTFIYHTIKTYKKYRTPEALYMEMAKKYPQLKNYKKHVINILNCQTIVPSTFELIQDLYNYGYPMHIMSNVGEQTFKALEEKHPEVFRYFSKKHTTKASENYLAKPTKEFFSKNIPQHFDHIIFIDDCKRNVNAAKSLGLTSIHYKGTKKLSNLLKKLKIIR